MCLFNIETCYIIAADSNPKKKLRHHLGLRDSNILSEVAQLPLCIEVIHLDKVKQEFRLFKIFMFLSFKWLGTFYNVAKLCLHVLHLEGFKKLPPSLISLGNVSWISYGSGILQCPTGHWVECPALQTQVVLFIIPPGQSAVETEKLAPGSRDSILGSSG